MAFTFLEKPRNLSNSNRVIPKAAFANLNIIRALSGLVVVFSHFFQLYVMPVVGRTRPINIAIASSEYAVLAFFTLSGFLIALSIERNIHNHGHFDWREYLISRVARIYPALIASIILCLILYEALHLLGIDGPGSLTRPSDVYPASRIEFSLTLYEVISTLMQTYAFGPGGYISANGPLWTLSYEVGFYLVAGLLITLMRGEGLSRIFSGVCLVLVAIVAIRMEKYLFLHYGTIWLLGVCLFMSLKNTRDCENINITEQKVYLANFSSWGIVFLFILLCLTNVLLALIGLDVALIHNWLASVFIITSLLGITRLRQNIFPRFIRLANSTYTLYLFHFPLMLFFYAVIRDIHDVSPFIYFVAASLPTICIVPVCHYLAKILEDRKLWELLLEKIRTRTTSFP